MSLDRSLKTKGTLAGVRSVLTRAERIERMRTDKKWDEKKSPVGIAKTRVGKK